MIPASISAFTSTVAPSSKRSRTLTFTATISFVFLFLNPLLGIRLYNGICPPSKPTLGAPERAFCPLWPLPAVLPFPEPCPRPLLKSLCLEPSAGLKLDNSIFNTSLSDYASSTFNKWLTLRICPLVASLSGSIMDLPILRSPIDSTIALFFGTAPIVDLTKVIFNFFSSILLLLPTA